MQTIQVPSGTYVLAVSGGVDSIVLLDILSRDQTLKLIVAHYDHGMRVKSDIDARFVANVAKKYGLDFFSETGHLGYLASEATARILRYEFLFKVKKRTNAQAIITAHHQDD